jgi:hypothetical protein
VQLKLEYGGERVVVVVRRIVIDVRLGGGIAKFFAARRRRLDALKSTDIFPLACVPLIYQQRGKIFVQA